jgi:hypothetical protein
MSRRTTGKENREATTPLRGRRDDGSSAAGEKHERARALVEELWQNRSGVVSTQVLQELAVNLRRKAEKPLDAKATRDVVSDYLAWHVVVNDNPFNSSDSTPDRGEGHE